MNPACLLGFEPRFRMTKTSSQRSNWAEHFQASSVHYAPGITPMIKRRSKSCRPANPNSVGVYLWEAQGAASATRSRKHRQGFLTAIFITRESATQRSLPNYLSWQSKWRDKISAPMRLAPKFLPTPNG